MSGESYGQHIFFLLVALFVRNLVLVFRPCSESTSAFLLRVGAKKVLCKTGSGPRENW